MLTVENAKKAVQDFNRVGKVLTDAGMWITFGGGDPVALMKKYGSRWKLMHLKDLRKGAPKNLTGSTGPENDVPLGQGEEDIPAILKEARAIGIKHFFIEDESVDPTMPVPQSIKYLRSLTD